MKQLSAQNIDSNMIISECIFRITSGIIGLSIIQMLLVFVTGHLNTSV